MTEPLYKGYSSVDANGADTAVFDLDLIIQDLRNHFNTRLGERVGRPTFGFIIWDMFFEPGDPRTETILVQDAQRIIALDPRVELLDIVPDIDIDMNTVKLSIRVKAVEFDMDGWFDVTFKQALAA